MTFWDAFILGIVEGLTEYLPVSSTGHLILTQRLLGLPDTLASHAYAIAIQGGAILAVLFLYKKRFLTVIKGLFGHSKEGRKLALNLGIAFLPAVIVGLVFEDFIQQFLFGLKPVAMAWLMGGLLILMFSSWFQKTPSNLDLTKLSSRQALIIGLCQCVALWPGVSRSLATIFGGLFAGIGLSASIEFSFLLGVLTLGAASVYQSLSHFSTLFEQPSLMIVGLLSSFVTAVISVRWMVGYLQKHPFSIFGWWRIGLGIITFLCFINV